MARPLFPNTKTTTNGVAQAQRAIIQSQSPREKQEILRSIQEYESSISQKGAERPRSKEMLEAIKQKELQQKQEIITGEVPPEQPQGQQSLALPDQEGAVIKRSTLVELRDSIEREINIATSSGDTQRAADLKLYRNYIKDRIEAIDNSSEDEIKVRSFQDPETGLYRRVPLTDEEAGSLVQYSYARQQAEKDYENFTEKGIIADLQSGKDPVQTIVEYAVSFGLNPLGFLGSKIFQIDSVDELANFLRGDKARTVAIMAEYKDDPELMKEKLIQLRTEELYNSYRAKNSSPIEKLMYLGSIDIVQWAALEAIGAGVGSVVGRGLGAAARVGGPRTLSVINVGTKALKYGIPTVALGVPGYKYITAKTPDERVEASSQFISTGLDLGFGYAGMYKGLRGKVKGGLSSVEKGAKEAYSWQNSYLGLKSKTFYKGQTVLEITPKRSSLLSDTTTGRFGKLSRPKPYLVYNPTKEYTDTLLKNIYDDDLDLFDWKYKAIAPDIAERQTRLSENYFDLTSKNFNVPTRQYAEDLIVGKQGGYQQTFQNVAGEKQGFDFYKFSQGAKSGIIRKSGPEIMGGTSAKYYPPGVIGDIDVDLARNRYILDTTQMNVNLPQLKEVSDVKPYVKRGQYITTTGYYQPKPYIIDNVRTAPLQKTASTTAEPVFALPKEEGIKSPVSSVSYFKELEFLRTGKMPDIEVPSSTVKQEVLPSGKTISYVSKEPTDIWKFDDSTLGKYARDVKSFTETPIIESSGRIRSIYQYQTLARKSNPMSRTSTENFPASSK